MDISVVICTCNRGESLRKVLAGLARQYNVNFISYEVVVVDNNSADNTKQVCEEYLALYPGVFRYIHEGRQGKTFALNTGVRASAGDIIAFTDDDVVIDRMWLLSVKQAFTANPGCKAFGGRVAPVWPDSVPEWIMKEGAFKNIGGAIVEHDLGEMVTGYHVDGVHFPCGANMFFSKDIFTQYGGFNEELNRGVTIIPMLEDIELCRRLLNNNENMSYIPDAVIYHPVAPERLTKKYFRKHAFKSGRAQYVIGDLQRRGQDMMLNLRKGRRRLLNVPFYVFRSIVETLRKYLFTMCARNTQAAQYYENMLVYNFGIMYECFGQRKNELPRN